MDEAREEKAMNMTCHRRLDFNLPLLSTRRLGGYPGTNSRIALQDTSNGVPFCWEQAPGKPKNVQGHDAYNGEGDTPRPRLPPCRWQPQKKATPSVNSMDIRDHDDGCDADIDDNDDDNDNEDDDVFTEAVDILSLTEAIDIVQKAEDDRGLDRLNLESVESRGSESPNFMIERFLPDATALASSSALYASSKNLSKRLPYFCSNYSEEYNSQTVGGYSEESSQKGCGLENFFPWRMKHKLCGVKSPVRQVSLSLQPACTAKQKKHCSTNRHFSEVNKYI